VIANVVIGIGWDALGSGHGCLRFLISIEKTETY
jgi:hypothetical protein